MAKYQNATQKTRLKIHEALWSLYEKKPIGKISVKEICDLVPCHRSTFYEYYFVQY